MDLYPGFIKNLLLKMGYLPLNQLQALMHLIWNGALVNRKTDIKAADENGS
jgi:hypothetical protein